MNFLLDLFTCFLIIVFTFSTTLTENQVLATQLHNNQHNWKKEDIEGLTEKKWSTAGGSSTEKSLAQMTTEGITPEKIHPSHHQQPSTQKPRTSVRKELQSVNDIKKSLPERSISGRTKLESSFRNPAQSDTTNSNMPKLAKNLPQGRGSTGFPKTETEKMESPPISTGWKLMVPQKLRKEQENKFHSLMCIADCKMADLMVFSLKNVSQTNHFLNMPISGRPYTYGNLIDWCKENCGSDNSWTMPIQEPKLKTTTLPTITTTSMNPHLISYGQKISPYDPPNYKPSFFDFKAENYEPPQFQPPRFTMWPRAPIFPAMPAQQILHYNAKSPFFQTVVPTIIVPPITLHKQNFFRLPEVMPHQPPTPVRSPIFYHDRKSGLNGVAKDFMKAHNVIGMNFRLKGTPFFAGTILNRPLAERSNIMPDDFDSGIDTRQWNNWRDYKQTVDTDTESLYRTTTTEEERKEEKGEEVEYNDSDELDDDDEEEEKEEIEEEEEGKGGNEEVKKEEEEEKENREAEKEEDKMISCTTGLRKEGSDGQYEREDVIEAILKLVRTLYDLVTRNKGVRSFLNTFFCEKENKVSVKHDETLIEP